MATKKGIEKKIELCVRVINKAKSTEELVGKLVILKATIIEGIMDNMKK